MIDDLNREIRKIQALSILLDSSDTLPEGVTDIMDEIAENLRGIAKENGIISRKICEAVSIISLLRNYRSFQTRPLNQSLLHPAFTVYKGLL